MCLDCICTLGAELCMYLGISLHCVSRYEVWTCEEQIGCDRQWIAGCVGVM